MENLTSLANAKQWLAVTTTTDDALLTRLISSSSRFILSYLQRKTFLLNSYAEILDGFDSRQVFPKVFPVLSLQSIEIGNQSITVVNDLTSCGAILEAWDGIPPGLPQAITLRGHKFWRGYGNVSISYQAGYAVQNEPYTIASPESYTVQARYGNWAADNGVTFGATAIALTLVTGIPATGQYSVSNGVYTFAAADAGKGVLINYSYIPSDIEEACIELVGERYRYKNRIGEVSKSLGGQETVSFSQKNMSDYVMTLLQPYQGVLV